MLLNLPSEIFWVVRSLGSGPWRANLWSRNQRSSQFPPSLALSLFLFFFLPPQTQSYTIYSEPASGYAIYIEGNSTFDLSTLSVGTWVVYMCTQSTSRPCQKENLNLAVSGWSLRVYFLQPQHRWKLLSQGPCWGARCGSSIRYLSWACGYMAKTWKPTECDLQWVCFRAHNLHRVSVLSTMDVTKYPSKPKGHDSFSSHLNTVQVHLRRVPVRVLDHVCGG